MRIRHIFHSMQDLEQRLSQRLCRRLRRLMQRVRRRWHDIPDAELLRALSVAWAFIAKVEDGNRMQAMNFDRMLHGQSQEVIEMEGAIIALGEDDTPLETMVWDSICLMLEEDATLPQTAQYAYDLADRHEVYAYSTEVIDEPTAECTSTTIATAAPTPALPRATYASTAAPVVINLNINLIINPNISNMSTITNDHCSFNAIHTQGGNVHISNDTYHQEPSAPASATDAQEPAHQSASDEHRPAAPSPQIADEELCLFIHPAVTDEEQKRQIHREIINLVTHYPLPDICAYLNTMASERRILLPMSTDNAMRELQRLGMPNEETEGFKYKNFAKYYRQ